MKIPPNEKQEDEANKYRHNYPTDNVPCLAACQIEYIPPLNANLTSL